MERKPNPDQELTKKVLDYWRNGVGRVAYANAFSDFHPMRQVIHLEVDNYTDIAPALRDKINYFDNCDFGENVPFVIVKDGYTGLKVSEDENKIPERVEAPELWIPGAYIRDDNASSFIRGFIDHCGLALRCFGGLISSADVQAQPLYAAAPDDRIKGRCKDGWEMSMCFYSYVVGISFFPNEENTMRYVEKGTLQAIEYRALEEKLRQSEAYRTVKDLERQCGEAGKLIAETIINPANEESKIRKSLHGFIVDYLKSLVKF